MVRKTKHKKGHKKTRRAKHGLPLRLAKLAIEKGTPRAKAGAARAGAYAKKTITKENLKKAIAASKEATSKLKALLHKKKKNGGQRITMSIFKT